MKQNLTEKDLIANGYKKETLSIHVTEYNDVYPNHMKQVGYDISDTFDGEQIAALKNWANEVNRRFLHIKIAISGTGYFKPEECISPKE